MKWFARTDATSIAEAVSSASGCSVEELVNPETLEPWEISNMDEAAILINKCIAEEARISIIGDYDADGVTATAILYLMFSALGVTPDIRLPYRMSEGYGLSVSIVDEILEKNPNGLLITVDNGIAALDAIRHAKAAGLRVLVLDHHLPGEQLPCADVIVDQWASSDAASCYYCGAGLAYKLAQYIITDKVDLLEKLAALAAIGTIGDVMRLTGDNRAIVRDGLVAIDNAHVTKGLQCLLDVSGKAKFDATTIAFYIVPMINAAGRLLDNGAKFPCAILSSDVPVPRHAEKLLALNNARKEMVKTQMETIASQLNQDAADTSMPIVIFSDAVHEGIAGILAGKLTEQYNVPAFVFASTQGHWKGSARSIDGVNLKERLDQMADQMLGYGGHAGAAGLSVKFGREDAFRQAVMSVFADVRPADSTIRYYDVTLSERQVPRAFEEQEQFEPFGEGCPKPLVCVRRCRIIPGRNNRLAFYMGQNGDHVKLKCQGFSILGFSLADAYKAMGEPECVNVIGYLEMNISQYGKELQVNAQAILPA